MRYLTLTSIVLLSLLAGRSDGKVTRIKKVTQPNFLPHEWSFQRFDRSGQRLGEVGGKAGDMSSVTVTDWDMNYVYTFSGGESYACESHHNDPHRHRCGHHHHCGPRSASLTVLSFEIHAKQRSVALVPHDAPKRLVKHEKAHININDYAYRKAFDRARLFSRGMLRRTFTGSSMDDVKSQLNNEFHRNFKEPFARWRDTMHNALNALDNHGHGEGMSPDSAYQRVIARHG